jgi:hypothetical protein
MNIPGLSPTTPVDIDSIEEISKKLKGEPPCSTNAAQAIVHSEVH